MKRIVPGLLLMVVATLQPRQAAAQDPNDPLLNMQAIAQALGVQCAYCHVRQTDNSTDFQADTNPKKAIARQMIAMTREINVPDTAFAEVRKHFSERQTVELTMLIGAYNMLTRFLQALKVDPEP